jgi:hypothetical protein
VVIGLLPGGGGLRDMVSPLFSCTGLVCRGVALTGGGFKTAASGGGIAPPVLLTVPVLERADAAHAVCLGWQGAALGGLWPGGGLVFGWWPGGGGFVLCGGARKIVGRREFVCVARSSAIWKRNASGVRASLPG